MNRVCMVSAALVLAAACGNAGTAGDIALPLSTTTADGTVYRLRDGQFQIGTAGGLSIGLSTEDDPDATAIHVDLDAGDYSIFLMDGWRLERSEAGGAFEPTGAALVGSNPKVFTVNNGATTEVSYIFRVEGADVTLGGGVDVTIDVYTPCDPVAQTGCLAGEKCSRENLADGSSRTTCGPDGTVAEGGACATPPVGFDDCVAGTACFGGLCAATCAPSTGPSCSCIGIFEDITDAGVCQPSCDPLAQDCPTPGQACYFGSTFAVCAGEGSGVQGDSCMFLNSCVEGSICSGGAGPGGGPGCAFICSLSGTGPTCAGPGGPGPGFTCFSAGVSFLPDVGVCR